MKRVFGLMILFGAMLALPAVSAGNDVVPELTIDGTTYHDVRWGPVHNGKITFLHSRGSQMNVPLEKLPHQYRRKFESANATPRGQNADSAFSRMKQDQAHRVLEREQARQAAFDAARAKYLMFEGQIVRKSSLTKLTGFLHAHAVFEGAEGMIHGVVLQVAQPRQTKQKIPDYMRMRPGLWEPTGEEIFLREYPLEGLLGELVTVYGLEKNPVRNMRSFVVGSELSADQMPPRR